MSTFPGSNDVAAGYTSEQARALVGLDDMIQTLAVSLEPVEQADALARYAVLRAILATSCPEACPRGWCT